MTTPPVSAPESTRGLGWRSRARLRGRAGDVILGAIGLVVLLALWTLVEAVWDPGSYILPSPTAVGREIIANLDVILANTAATFRLFGLGYAIAIVAGVLLAVLISFFEPASRVVWPLSLTIHTIPNLAIAPILVLLFGIGLLPKLLLIVLTAFFPVLTNTSAGLRSVDRRVWDLAQSFGMGRVNYFARVEAWAALPLFFVGARIAVTYSIIAALIAEFVSSSEGLGNLVRSATSAFNMPLALAIVSVVALASVLIYLLVTAIERLATPWIKRAVDGKER